MPTLKYDKEALTTSMGGAALVMIAVSLMNGVKPSLEDGPPGLPSPSDDAPGPIENWAMGGLTRDEAMLAAILFVGGWFLAARAGSMSVAKGYTPKSAVALKMFAAFGGAAMVLAAVYVHKSKKQDLPPAVQPYAEQMQSLFALGWLVFALGVSMRRGQLNNKSTPVALLGAALVVTSMQHTLPAQRRMNMVDGPGMAMFSSGWTMIALASSLIV